MKFGGSVLVTRYMSLQATDLSSSRNSAPTNLIATISQLLRKSSCLSVRIDTVILLFSRSTFYSSGITSRTSPVSASMIISQYLYESFGQCVIGAICCLQVVAQFV